MNFIQKCIITAIMGITSLTVTIIVIITIIIRNRAKPV